MMNFLYEINWELISPKGGFGVEASKKNFVNFSQNLISYLMHLVSRL